MEANEFFDRSNPGRLRLQLAVASDERGDRGIGRPPKDFPHPGDAQSLDTNSRFGPQPHGMRSQAILKSLPLLFGKALAISQERPNGGRTKRGHGGGMSRVETRDQGQRLSRNDSR